MISNTVELFDTLASNLRSLMQSKNINEAELARNTKIPQPTLHKILSKKTIDPRASTLKALANYFGLTIDELLNTSARIRKEYPLFQTQPIAMISWSDCGKGSTFINTLTQANWEDWLVSEIVSINAFALRSKPSMEPHFPRGTILIINPELTAEDGDIILVHYPDTHEATLRQISVDGPTTLLLPINANTEKSMLSAKIRILGVLVKSIFSYH
jgi:SOS-response transcriptional repressor LexA